MNESVYILMPAYNEDGVIRETLKKLIPHFKNIVVVNDGSADNTEKIAKEFDVIVFVFGLLCLMVYLVNLSV